jgi:hypothetical protein
MNKKLYKLHELYGKHNYDNVAHTGTWMRHEDKLQCCTCGGVFRAWDKGALERHDGESEFFYFEDINDIYLAHLLQTVQQPLLKDLITFVIKTCGKSQLRKARKITVAKCTEYQKE